MTEIAEAIATAGDDAAHVWDYAVQAAKTSMPAGSFTVTGGLSAISRGLVVAFGPAAYVIRESATITPLLGGVWLKNVAKPYLNRKVTIKDWTDPERPSRAGQFDVVNRAEPIEVSDVRGTPSWTMTLLAESREEAELIDLLISGGDIVLVHVPPERRVPGGYVSVGDSAVGWIRHSELYQITLPMKVMAPPGGNTPGLTVTWQGVLNRFATWDALIAACPTWNDVLALINTPQDALP